MQRGARTEWQAIGYASKMCSAALKGKWKEVRPVGERGKTKEERKEGGGRGAERKKRLLREGN